MSRFAPPDPQTYTEAQARVAERIASGPRAGVRGPLAMWLHRPDMADPAQALGAWCRYGSSLPPRLSELAILTTAVHWQADYEWAAHEGPARKAGLGDDVIAALKAGQVPDFATEDEALLHRFSCELLTTRRIGDETYAKAIAVLGRDAVIDLVAVLGYYALISMTITAFDIPAAEPVF